MLALNIKKLDTKIKHFYYKLATKVETAGRYGFHVGICEQELLFFYSF